jgi:hypothetical protein
MRCSPLSHGIFFKENKKLFKIYAKNVQMQGRARGQAWHAVKDAKLDLESRL